MSPRDEIPIDCIIFGGGIAGLWILDELKRRGVSVVLLESRALGSGQTIASQGILHGGLKYSLDGLLNPSARAIRDMPAVWRACLAGEREPDLRCVQLRAERCHIWRTQSIGSRLGMAGAKVGLQVKPKALAIADRPDALADCPGTVAELGEQVIEPGSLLAVLGEKHGPALCLAAPDDISINRTGSAWQVAVHESVVFRPRTIVCAAGTGNEALSDTFGIDAAVAAQRRPLHMALARGENLPVVNGHCVDGSKTRVTITTTHDRTGHAIWQIGGEVAEAGVEMSPSDLVAHVQRELAEVLPGVDMSGARWATYRVDRAEPKVERGTRPETAVARRVGDVIIAWPTKLVLAPYLAGQVAEQIGEPVHRDQPDVRALGLPAPLVALPPWEEVESWM